MKSTLVLALWLVCFSPVVLFGRDTITIRVGGGMADNRKMDRGLVEAKLSDDATVLDALLAVGGAGADAWLTKVVVTRLDEKGAAQRTEVDCIAALKAPETAFHLRSGDLVYVPISLMDTGHVPDFFNGLLLGWGYFKSQGTPPTNDWREAVKHLAGPRGSDDRQNQQYSEMRAEIERLKKARN